MHFPYGCSHQSKVGTFGKCALEHHVWCPHGMGKDNQISSYFRRLSEAFVNSAHLLMVEKHLRIMSPPKREAQYLKPGRLKPGPMSWVHIDQSDRKGSSLLTQNLCSLSCFLSAFFLCPSAKTCFVSTQPISLCRLPSLVEVVRWPGWGLLRFFL